LRLDRLTACIAVISAIWLNPAANGLIAYRNQLSPIMTGEHIDEFSDHRACRRGFQHSLYADSVKWVPATGT
jgi:hypothetical protein